MISIEKAFELVEKEIENDNLRKHMLAVSKIMDALADKPGIGEEDKEKWILVGLLHDLDYEKKKFSDKSFARSMSRENIMICEELGFERNEFFKLALEALQTISDELGL